MRQQLLRCPAFPAYGDIVALVREHAGAALAQRVFIIDDDDLDGRARRLRRRREIREGSFQRLCHAA